jgi:formamidopyrimidine-DNA glycosylase
VPKPPDIDLSVEKIDARVGNQSLERVRVNNPFLVRSFDPPLDAVR